MSSTTFVDMMLALPVHVTNNERFGLDLPQMDN